jgi:hypothetical protein
MTASRTLVISTECRKQTGAWFLVGLCVEFYHALDVAETVLALRRSRLVSSLEK